jgi:hypothetical protein
MTENGPEALTPIKIPQVTSSEFSFQKWAFPVHFDRVNISQFAPGFILPVPVKLDPSVQEAWGAPEFIIFEAIVTSTHEIEQLGEGCPCSSEQEIKRISEIIREKNETSPYVVVASWEGRLCHRDAFHA